MGNNEPRQKGLQDRGFQTLFRILQTLFPLSGQRFIKPIARRFSGDGGRAGGTPCSSTVLTGPHNAKGHSPKTTELEYKHLLQS